MKNTLLTMGLSSLFFSSILFSSCSSEKTTSTDSKTSPKTQDTSQVNTSKVTNKKKTELNYTRVIGFDISKDQGDFIDKVQPSDSITFVFCKATEGVTYTDPNFASNWEKISQKGYYKGAYHFYHLDDDPTEQAKFFLSTLGKLDNNQLTPVLDIEDIKGAEKVGKETVMKDVITFLTYIKQNSGKTPILYTYVSFANAYLTDAAFGEYPLWIADYEKTEQPVVPSAWKENGYKLWQKSGDYKSHDTTIDFDVYHGDFISFKSFIKEINQ